MLSFLARNKITACFGLNRNRLLFIIGIIEIIGFWGDYIQSNASDLNIRVIIPFLLFTILHLSKWWAIRGRFSDGRILTFIVYLFW